MSGSDEWVLPTEFAAGRFWVRPVTLDGQELRLFTDTGGGLHLVESVVRRLGLPTETVELEGRSVQVTSLPEFRPGAAIPPVSVEDDPRYPSLRGRLLVLGDNHPSVFRDGMLGQVWFGGRTWTFDYVNERLVLHKSPPDDRRFEPEHTVPVGFPTNAEGRRGSHFPSIEATIDAETWPFLLDTGATVTLSDEALAVMGDDGPAERGGCFVASSMFERWRKRHPEWRIIERADLGVGAEPMIELESVSIAGFTVGPAWFARRADVNFHEHMSRMMDRRIEGALGAPVLGNFVLTVDYPRGLAGFSRS